MLTHRNLLFVAAASAAIRRLRPQDRIGGIMPVSHIVGLTVVLLGTLMHGASVQLLARFNPAEMLRVLACDGLSVVNSTPAMLGLLLDYAGRKGIRRLSAPTLRILAVSGAPLDPAIKTATERLFGLPLHHGYGITECAPTIAQVRPARPREDCSVGPLLPGVEARVVGPDGAPVAAGEVGELHVRGPNVMRGYYRACEETAQVLDAAGWFNTRDLVRFEDDSLFIVGRAKELIIRFGFNVYPPEIEAVLNAHPAVRQSAVVGRPVAGNEEVVAFVQPVAGATLTDRELADYAAARLAPYKRPTTFVLVDTMPSTPSGKILKRDLEIRAISAANTCRSMEETYPSGQSGRQ
jgi:acyl-CoA synthetase (AMP-forming)/AMP-acid ligase II